MNCIYFIKHNGFITERNSSKKDFYINHGWKECDKDGNVIKKVAKKKPKQKKKDD